MSTKFPSLSIKSKLLALLILASLSSVAVLGYLGYQSGKSALTQSIYDHLDSLRATKKRQVEWYFENLRRNVRGLGQDKLVETALLQFTDGFKEFGLQAPSREERDLLRRFYKDEFLPRIANTRSEAILPATYWPRSWSAQKLQSLFISGNPYKVGEKDKLVRSKGINAYHIAHAHHHDHFRKFLRRNDFYDVFLIDAKSSAIVYSVFKEVDFGTNLEIGPYANSGLAELYREIVASHFPGQVKSIDYNFYAPSYNAPAAFIGTPLYKDGKFAGVLAAQISVEALDTFMTGGQGWKREGLGETGEVYFVGPDRLMRSQSRFMAKDKTEYLNRLRELAVPDETIRNIEKLGTTILLQRADNRSVRAALRGKSGTVITENYRGVPVLSSFSPIDSGQLRWVIVAEKAVSEAFKPIDGFRRKVVIAACIIALLSALSAMGLSALLLKPVGYLLDGIERLRRGESDVEIVSRSRDEFGELTRAFNRMADEIKSRDKVIKGKSQAYEALLRSIFPDAVADRLKEGEAQFVDSFPMVSIIYTTVHGFTRATDHMDGDDSIELLNEIVDRFDAAGESLGVEKVKTIGEHYLAACGLTVPRLDHACRALDFAKDIHGELQAINIKHDLSLTLRIGIDSGPVHAGLVGSRRFVYDVWGRAANHARRIAYEAEPGTARITEATRQLLDSSQELGDELTVRTPTQDEIRTFQLPLGPKAKPGRESIKDARNRPKSHATRAGRKEAAPKAAE